MKASDAKRLTLERKEVLIQDRLEPALESIYGAIQTAIEAGDYQVLIQAVQEPKTIVEAVVSVLHQDGFEIQIQEVEVGTLAMLVSWEKESTMPIVDVSGEGKL